MNKLERGNFKNHFSLFDFHHWPSVITDQQIWAQNEMFKISKTRNLKFFGAEHKVDGKRYTLVSRYLISFKKPGGIVKFSVNKL